MLPRITKNWRKLFVCAAILTSMATSSMAANDANWSKYMSTAALNANVQNGDIQLVDIRSKKYVAKGTIPGAIWMTYKTWRGPQHRPGLPPSETALEDIVGQAGLTPDKPLVIFNHSGKALQTGQAAYVYWLLKSAGFEQIAILNGGFKAWAKAEMPIAVEPRTLEPQVVDLQFRRDWWADPMDIFGVATGQKDGAILDARLDSQVKKSIKTGKPIKSLPLAHYIPAGLLASNLTSAKMSTEGKSEFRQDLMSRGIELNGDILISICQTGELSALSWFYASEIVEIENVQYYPDALQGWKADGGLLFGLNLNRQ